MNNEKKYSLSEIPLEVLVEEIESRKFSEVKILIAEINANLARLKAITGSNPYNKILLKEDKERWELNQLGIEERDNKIIDIYYEDKKIYEE